MTDPHVAALHDPGGLPERPAERVKNPTSEMRAASAKVVYWHRELPPPDAEAIGEHTIEATSARVPGSLGYRDRVWDACYDDLMAEARRRLEQEVTRLGGHYAHVFEEAIDSRRDDAKGEAWLHGRFDYILYRRSSTAIQSPKA